MRLGATGRSSAQRASLKASHTPKLSFRFVHILTEYFTIFNRSKDTNIYIFSPPQSGALAPEGSAKRGFLCSNGYKYLFNSCRVPGPLSDWVHCYDPSDPRAMEVTVSRKGQFFVFSMLGDDGKLLGMADVEQQLASIIEMAGSVNEPSLGALSAADRDAWWQAREGLLRIDGNKEALEGFQQLFY